MAGYKKLTAFSRRNETRRAPPYPFHPVSSLSLSSRGFHERLTDTVDTVTDPNSELSLITGHTLALDRDPARLSRHAHDVGPLTPHTVPQSPQASNLCPALARAPTKQDRRGPSIDSTRLHALTSMWMLIESVCSCFAAVPSPVLRFVSL